MAPDDPRPRHPTWVRVVLVGLQVVGLAGGLVLGNVTYDNWSESDEPEPPTTTSVVVEDPVPADTLG